tara:strand:+ start:116755 stop:117105 length:351 start_codon:yes stop_codon:yes gene_type:complete
MKHILLKPKRSLIASDFAFLAKIPLIPNQYIWKEKRGKLALLKDQSSKNLLLLTNQEGFLKQYDKYYQLYFEVSDLEATPNLESYDLLYGEHGISQALSEEDFENSEDLDDSEIES